MSKEVRRSIRLSREMAEAIDLARGDVSWSKWVERALEKALGSSGGGGTATVHGSSASSRPSDDPPFPKWEEPPVVPPALVAKWGVPGQVVKFGSGHLPTCKCAVCKPLKS